MWSLALWTPLLSKGMTDHGAPSLRSILFLPTVNPGTVVPSAPRTVFPGWDADKGSTSYVYTFLKYLDQSILWNNFTVLNFKLRRDELSGYKYLVFLSCLSESFPGDMLYLTFYHIFHIIDIKMHRMIMLKKSFKNSQDLSNEKHCILYTNDLGCSTRHNKLGLAEELTLKLQMMKTYCSPCNLQFSSVQSIQSLSHIWLFATPWTVVCQAFLSNTNS